MEKIIILIIAILLWLFCQSSEYSKENFTTTLSKAQVKIQKALQELKTTVNTVEACDVCKIFEF